MKVLVFDTETTGLPKGYPSIYDTTKWPYVVQLSWLVYDIEKNDVEKFENFIINCDGEISEESIKIHKITPQISKMVGVGIKDCLIKMKKDLLSCDLMIGHNISFDKQILIVESIRNNLPPLFMKKNCKRMNQYCLMKNTVNFVGIEKINKYGKEYFKYPKLSELYMKLFGEEMIGAHDSLADSIFTLRCYCVYNNYNDPMTSKYYSKLFKKYCS